jgi:hypothetical protein
MEAGPLPIRDFLRDQRDDDSVNETDGHDGGERKKDNEDG